MDDIIDNNLDNISELKLLESLDLGHRRVFKEEEKQKENDDFVDNINLLLSKLNERIYKMKSIPKLQIKSFDIDSINDENNDNINDNINDINNNMPENENKKQPLSENPSKFNTNKLSSLNNTNNFNNITTNTPYPLEDSANNKINNNRKFRIPDSANEKFNRNPNNINIATPGGNFKLRESSNLEDSKAKQSINNKDNITDNMSIDKENMNDKNDKKDEDELHNEIELKNIDEIEDDIPEMSDHNKSPREANINNDNKPINKKETIESNNYIISNLKEEDDENNKNEKEKSKIQENNEDNNNNEDKESDMKIDVEEIETFQPENENSEKNVLKNINKNGMEKTDENNKSEIESNGGEKERLTNKNEQSNQEDKIEEKKESEEDQYDKEFNQLENNFKNMKSVLSNNNDDINNNKSKNIENEEKNDLKNRMVKIDEASVDVETSDKRKIDEKKETEEKKEQKEESILEIKDDSISEQKEDKKDDKEKRENENNKENEDKKVESIMEINDASNSEQKEEDKEKKKAEEKKEKKDKKEESVMEINSESISEQKEDKKDNKENKEINNVENGLNEPKEDKSKNNVNTNKIINNISKNSIEDDDLASPRSRNKSGYTKTNTMPQKDLDHSIKKSIKKSLTQGGDILIQIRPSNTKASKNESAPDPFDIDGYPILENLNGEEKALDEIIPEFNENILKNEQKKEIDSRKSSLIKKKLIQLKINEGQEYSQYLGEIQEPHTEVMQINYNEENFKSKLNYEKKSKLETFQNLTFDEINSPIGPIESFEGFSQKYILEKEDVKTALSSSFSKWRKILGDGNSFYRIIMFGLIEAYILNKNINELKILINDIISDDKIKIYDEKNINMESCCIVFSEILFMLEEEEDNNKAYEIFIKAYAMKDGSFDKLLIFYLRYTLSFYIKQAKELLPEEEKNNINNTNIFNSCAIESPNIEPSFLDICCFQYLFDIKINLIYLQGGISNPVQRSINLIGEEEDNCPFLNIGFFYSSYHRLYPSNFEVAYNCVLPAPKNINKSFTYILKDTRPCAECKSNTEHIMFLEKKFIICKFCLENYLTKICNFRADAFERNGFLGLEYYTRPINLVGNYYIDDYEIIELIESGNLLEILIQKYTGVVCSNCHRKEENTIELKCGCEFCKKCLENLVLSKTKGIKVLNDFEKKQIQSTKCICGNPFDIEEGLKVIQKNKDDKIESLNRLEKYVNTLCLICSKELRVEGQKKNEYVKKDETINYKIIKMKKMEGQGLEKEINESDHLICDECYNQNLKRKIELNDSDDEDDRTTRNDFIDFEKELIACSICCKNHLFRITQNEGCCAGDCLIF